MHRRPLLQTMPERLLLIADSPSNIEEVSALMGYRECVVHSFDLPRQKLVSLKEQEQDMDILTKEDLTELSIRTGEACVSIYMPTTPIGRESQQGPILLKNLIRRTEETLTAEGMGVAPAQKLLEPALSVLADDDFWQHQSDGLALFASPGMFRCYRLPQSFDELVVVSQRFHLKPLLPLFTGNGSFFVLALSQNAVRLLQCTRDTFRQVELQGIPTSMEDALEFDDPERQLQYHTSAGSPGAAGKRSAIFHGHGVGTDDEKINLSRYFRKVNQGLHELLRDQTAPLVLAGVEYLHPIYKEVNDYPHLIEQGIEGSPDRWGEEELHQLAWKIVEPLFAEAQQEATDRYRQLAGSKDGKGLNDLKKIIRAAMRGQVETLFVVEDLQQWGRFDPDANSIQLHDDPQPHDEDLLDLAAVHTTLNRGTVHVLKAEEMPDSSPIAAILRYEYSL
jgi:hypothetical protein